MLASACKVITLPSCSSQQANEDVTQIVEIFLSGPTKWNWLTRRLVEFTSSGSVLLFVTKKANAEELANNLKQEGHNLGLLHGDMDQSERNKVISEFKKKGIPILVATDVAGKEYISYWNIFKLSVSTEQLVNRWRKKLLLHKHLNLVRVTWRKPCPVVVCS